MQAISEETRVSYCSALPLELWERIIAEITDPRYHPRAWLNIRRVSQLLKAATEHVFVTKHLPQSRLEFKPLVLREGSLARSPGVVEIPLAFDRLSDDRTRAFFAAKDGFENLKDITISSHTSGATETVYDKFTERWKALIRPYQERSPSLEDVCFPAHCFVMYGDVNDTELPGVEFDVERFTVSVQWERMLSIFYGEVEYQKWATKVVQQHASRVEEGLLGTAAPVSRGSNKHTHILMQKPSTTETNKPCKEDDKKICEIRIMRFKRMLRKMEYQEKGQDIADGFFEKAGRASFVESVKYALCWDRDDGEYTQQGDERGHGCFYDGMGMQFDGKSETNQPGLTSNIDDE